MEERSSSKAICVYCGANPGHNPLFLKQAKRLGEKIAQAGITLVYGGSSAGTMGALAEAALENKGSVIGVIAPEVLRRESAAEGLTELIITDSMFERKNKMIELSDGFIVLPGGAGTLEEFSDVLSRARLGTLNKPIGLVNTHGFYDHLMAQFEHMAAQGFLMPEYKEMLHISDDLDELVQFCITVFKTPHCLAPTKHTTLAPNVSNGEDTII